MAWNLINGWITLDPGQRLDIHALGHHTLILKLTRAGQLCLEQIDGDHVKVVEITEAGLIQVRPDGQHGESLAWG